MKIQITASAGQGTKLISIILGKILADQDIEVYTYTLYGPNVRKGNVSSFLVTDKKPIQMPFFEKSDLLIELAQTDESLPYSKKVKGEVFINLAEKLNLREMTNFIILGYILNSLNVKLDIKKISEFVPKIISKDWEKAVNAGYSIK